MKGEWSMRGQRSPRRVAARAVGVVPVGVVPVGVVRGADRERGSASLWLLALGLVLVAAALAGAAVGAARVARHQARTAADLAALAGAARTLDDPHAACTRAAEFAGRNGARLVGCTVDGLDLQITVAVAVTPPIGRLDRVAMASARAGPVRG